MENSKLILITIIGIFLIIGITSSAYNLGKATTELQVINNLINSTDLCIKYCNDFTSDFEDKTILNVTKMSCEIGCITNTENLIKLQKWE